MLAAIVGVGGEGEWSPEVGGVVRMVPTGEYALWCCCHGEMW